MDFKCTLLIILQFIVIWGYRSRKRDYVIDQASNCKNRNFYPQTETYTFSATTSINCKFEMSVPFYYGSRLYCISADYVFLDGCSATLFIYKEFTSLKMVFSCDEKIDKSFCVTGSSSFISISYRVSIPSKNVIKLRIIPESRPATTTARTESVDEKTSATTSNSLIGILVFAGVFFFMVMVYFCCCRKTANGDEEEETARSVNPQLSAPMIAPSTPPQQDTRSTNDIRSSTHDIRSSTHDLRSSTHDIRSSTHDLYSNISASVHDPPEYSTVTPSSVIQPSAPLDDSTEENKDLSQVPPPSYDEAVLYMTSTQF